MKRLFCILAMILCSGFTSIAQISTNLEYNYWMFNNGLETPKNILLRLTNETISGATIIYPTNWIDVAQNWQTRVTNTVSIRVNMSKDGSCIAWGSSTSPGTNLFVSTNYGQTFTARLTDTNRMISAISFSYDGKHIMLQVTGQGGHLTSADYGVTWTTNGDLTRFCGLAKSSADGMIRAAFWTTNGLTGGGYLNLSYDYGVTWTALTNLPPVGNVSATPVDELSSDGKYISYQLGASGLFQSRDYGMTWVTNALAFVTSSRATAVSSDGKYQAHPDYNNAIYISTDYGVTWNTNNNAPQGVSNGKWTSISVSSDGSKMVVGNDNKTNIWYSLDYGTTWASNAISGKIGAQGIAQVTMSWDGKYVLARDGSSLAYYISTATNGILGMNIVPTNTTLLNSYLNIRGMFTSGTNNYAMIDTAHSALQFGELMGNARMINKYGSSSIQLGYLTSGQTNIMTGKASIGIGATTVTDNQSIVVGDGQQSHGDGSITARGGVWTTNSPASNNWVVNWQSMTGQNYAVKSAYNEYNSSNKFNGPVFFVGSKSVTNSWISLDGVTNTQVFIQGLLTSWKTNNMEIQ